MRKIAFIFSQFPCYDETFILREMNQLKKSGLNFCIYSIKPCRDKIIHADAQKLAEDVQYLPLFSLNLLLVNLYSLLRHPLRYWGAFFGVFWGNLKSPVFLFKSMCLFPQAVGFARIARKYGIEHVHGQWATYPATYAYVISKLNNIPFSFTGHAHDIYLDTKMLAEKIEEAKFVVTCTQDNKRYLLKLLESRQPSAVSRQTKDKIIVNYHGVDLERFKISHQPSAISHQPFKILSVGSLLECKGFDILIDACKILQERGIDFECTIAGGGPLLEKLKLSAVRHQLSDQIKFTGYITQDKLIPFYQNADVFALPVRLGIHWGIPNVVIEAMAAKVPVITGNLPSIPEIIADGKTGFIIPEENPQALAGALVRLYDDAELRKTVGNAGYAVVAEKFDVAKNAASLKVVFESRYG